jgi:hypothetical protein
MTRSDAGTRTPRWWARQLVAWPVMLAMIAGTVVLGRLILNTTPIGDDFDRPFIHNGQMREPVDAHDFVVTVESIRGGRGLAQIFNTATTDGVFLLVKIRVSAYDEATTVGYQALVDGSGNTYEADERDYAFRGHTLQPRIPVEAELAFELPTAAVTNHLMLLLSSYPSGHNAHQVMAQIALDITDAQLASWTHQAEPLKPMDPEVTI